jgi:hypothetical protein
VLCCVAKHEQALNSSNTISNVFTADQSVLAADAAVTAHLLLLLAAEFQLLCTAGTAYTPSGYRHDCHHHPAAT